MQTLPRAIAFDLDNTLAESKRPLAPEMGALVAALLDKTHVALMSGAGFPQLHEQFLNNLPEYTNLSRLLLYPTNGAQCWQFDGASWHRTYDHAFTPEEAARITKILENAIESTGILAGETRQWGERIENRGAQITFSALGQKAPVEEKRTFDPDKKKRILLRDALLPQLTGCAIGIGGETSVDITREGITKAFAVRELAKTLGAQISELLYVGDALEPGGNDAVVHETGVPTQTVKDPSETAVFIQNILAE